MTATTTRPAGFRVEHREPGGTRWAVLGVVPDRGTATDVAAELAAKHAGEFRVEPVGRDAEGADR